MKLSKDQIGERDSIIEALREGEGKIEDALSALNMAINDYNTALDDARTWKEGVVEAIDEHIEAKTDKWKEGEAGEAHSAWKDSFDELELDDLEEVELDAKRSVLLEGLQDEPG